MTIDEKELRKFLTKEEKESLDLAKEEFEESIEVARESGVPEHLILKSIDDIEDYFMN